MSVHLLLLLIPPGQIGFLPVRQDLKINVVISTENEKNIFEEFNKLEDKTTDRITLVKSTNTPRKQKNKRHNRYSDISKTHIFSE